MLTSMGLLMLGVMTLPKTIITFIIVLGVLIFVHEFGHYIVAKWVGVRVEEFALGFGPKILGFRKGETDYSLRIFPLGGFCKMTGEFPHAEEELEGEELALYKEAVDNGRALYQKSVLQRFGVMFCGPLMNFVLALLLFAIIFTAVGVPFAGSNAPIIGGIVPNEPADKAKIKVNDRIVSVEGQTVQKWDDISRAINAVKTDRVSLVVERAGERKMVSVEPKYDKQAKKRVIGIYPGVIYKKVPFGTALVDAAKETWFTIVAIGDSFAKMITRQAPADVAGPVMIAKLVGDAAEVGWVYLLRLTALISINLGILNLVPFPALDGGRILFLGIELVRGKAVDPAKEGFVHFIGFVILMALIVLVLYKDIVSIF